MISSLSNSNLPINVSSNIIPPTTPNIKFCHKNVLSYTVLRLLCTVCPSNPTENIFSQNAVTLANKRFQAFCIESKFMVEMARVTQMGPFPSAALRLPFQSPWAIGYRPVHRTARLHADALSSSTLYLIEKA